jgi:hypothetical protein
LTPGLKWRLHHQGRPESWNDSFKRWFYEFAFLQHFLISLTLTWTKNLIAWFCSFQITSRKTALKNNVIANAKLTRSLHFWVK